MYLSLLKYDVPLMLLNELQSYHIIEYEYSLMLTPANMKPSPKIRRHCVVRLICKPGSITLRAGSGPLSPVVDRQLAFPLHNIFARRKWIELYELHIS